MNLNSGYGQKISQALHSAFSRGGKLVFVAKSSSASRLMLQELFPTDPDGMVRYASTIDSAIGYCTSSRRDVIVVAQDHTETISSATALNLDVAGIKIVGLGEGSLRPTITLDTATTTTIPVSANNITIENCIFTANFADIVSVFTLTTAKYLSLVNCRFQATATNMNFLYIVDTNTTDNAADGLSIIGCEWVEPDLATVSMIKVDADLDNLAFSGNYLNLGVNTSDLPAIATVATGKDLTNARIGGPQRKDGNVIIRLNDANPLLITADTTTANTGYIANNYVRHLDTAGELLVTAGTNFGFFDNKATAAVDASGYLLPVADS